MHFGQSSVSHISDTGRPKNPDIYLAPLQETYSEALSVQLRPKRNVLRSRRKTYCHTSITFSSHQPSYACSSTICIPYQIVHPSPTRTFSLLFLSHLPSISDSSSFSVILLPSIPFSILYHPY